VDDADIKAGMMVRRARLKFSGFAYSPKLKYKIELGLTNRDIGGSPIPEENNTSKVVLDAVGKWSFARNFELWFGQTKLPGNRERVISSQALQFVDRSLVNSKYNIDRDSGLQLRHNWSPGKSVIREILSVSQGEGRNITSGNKGGLDYTARVEYLPFGKFEGKGDYFSSDLKREEKPKLAIGITYDYNDNASRQNGNLKSFLQVERDLQTIFVDLMFKNKGWSVMAEYADKQAPAGSVVVMDSEGSILESFYTGTGLNFQVGYLLKNNLEIAGRYTSITPSSETNRSEITMYTLGISRYLSGHNLKVQSDISLTEEGDDDETLLFRAQVEISF
jgi:phosphate-selective porin OprO/OprP